MLSIVPDSYSNTGCRVLSVYEDLNRAVMEAELAQKRLCDKGECAQLEKIVENHYADEAYAQKEVQIDYSGSWISTLSNKGSALYQDEMYEHRRDQAQEYTPALAEREKNREQED